MNTVGQKERFAQNRVVALFRDTLKYNYLGNWESRADNRNIEPELLRALLTEGGVDANFIARALFEIEKSAGDTGKNLYDRNRAVYQTLRYGVQVRPEVGEDKQTVHLINWKNPHLN